MGIKEDFEQNGYVVIDTELPLSVLDGAIEDLSPYFGPDRVHPIHVPSADPGRIQDAWHISQNVLKIAQAPAVDAALQEIYGEKPKPFQTLNFHKGTEQAAHSDSIHFNSEPFGAMCGVWTALEDIGPDQGPLIYYPGSQKLPEMNYDDFGLEATVESYPAYLDELQAIIKRENYQPEYGLIKKGQSLIWCANILHGGSIQNDKELTRHSQVTHFYLGDCKTWRPVQSQQGRKYFEPDWVRDVSGEPYKFPIQPAPTEPVPIPVKPSLVHRIKRKLRSFVS